VAVVGPRLVIAGTASGVGKTTVCTGVLAALARRGLKAAGAKIGPDFIDPGYHAAACGRPPRNLDAWMCGLDRMPSLAARAAEGQDLLVAEGVMGLFDGAADGTASSTADVARVLRAPVILVVDASAMAASAGAVVHGFASFDPSINVAGVVFNRVGSDGHETMLKEAVAGLGIPVLGALRRDERFSWRDRHLGLVPVSEDPLGVRSSLDRLASAIEAYVDLDAVVAVARKAEPLDAPPVETPNNVGPSRIAVAAGPAFSFTYTDTVETLQSAGAEIVTFDPLVDETLPYSKPTLTHRRSPSDPPGGGGGELDGLFIGGGFPELYAASLSANRRLLEGIKAEIAGGLVTWAECGGLLVLCESLDGHPLAGVLAARAEMTNALTLGYRTAVTTVQSPLGPPGTALRGHEFHYSRVSPSGSALAMRARFGEGHDGYATATLIATYLHYHPGGSAAPLEHFATKAALRRAARRASLG
jgi:cobyrinic acid a,c-diamide synthase